MQKSLCMFCLHLPKFLILIMSKFLKKKEERKGEKRKGKEGKRE